ncbi:hypothetical protein [Streptomyces sp. NPDC001594]|uniref:hypothetical protein n=1 Tax=Streptomyces sp. NPDC001594 TaxID=3364590 RepID=UPI0036A922E9
MVLRERDRHDPGYVAYVLAQEGFCEGTLALHDPARLRVTGLPQTHRAWLVRTLEQLSAGVSVDFD